MSRIATSMTLEEGRHMHFRGKFNPVFSRIASSKFIPGKYDRARKMIYYTLEKKKANWAIGMTGLISGLERRNDLRCGSIWIDMSSI